MSRCPRIVARLVAVLSCGLLLSACVSGFGRSGLTLSEQLTGGTVVFDGPAGLPAERTTYNADGTLSRFFRPLLLPDRLSRGGGYWWIEHNRYCTSDRPRMQSGAASCYTVMIRGDRIRFKPWNRPKLTIFPELRMERKGRLFRDPSIGQPQTDSPPGG